MDLSKIRQLSSVIIIGFIALLLFFPLRDILSHDLIYFPYDLIIFKVIILICLIYLLVCFNRTSRLILPDWLFFLFLIYLDVSNLLSSAPMDEYSNLRPYLAGVFYCVIRLMLTDRRLLYFFTFSSCVLTLYCGFIILRISTTPFDQIDSDYILSKCTDNSNFFAIIMPLLLFRQQTLLLNKRWTYFIKAFIFATGLVVLCISKERTAVLALLIVALVFLQRKYTFKKTWVLYCLIPLIIVGMINYRPGSAKGRLLIYTVSLEMIKSNPVTGIGYGKFPALYNEYQASYLSKGGVIDDRKYLAGNVYSPYNEALHLICESGFIGLIIFLAFVITLFFPFIRVTTKQLPDEILLPFISLLVCCQFSYPLCYTPVLMFSILLLALTVNLVATSYSPLSISFRVRNLAIAVTGLAIFADIAISFTYVTALSKWQQAMKLALSNQIAEAKEIYKSVFPILKQNGKFLYNFGAELSVAGQAAESNAILEMAQCYYTSSDLHIFKASNYELLNGFYNAEREYAIAWNMVPTQLYSRYRWFHLCNQSHKNGKAVSICRDILQVPVKVPSNLSNSIRQEASAYLSEYSYLSKLPNFALDFIDKELLAYNSDSLYTKALLFTLEKIPYNYALQNGKKFFDTPQIDYPRLVDDIHFSVNKCRDSINSGALSIKDFFEFVLPYRLANEPINYWKQVVYDDSKLKIKSNGCSYQEICANINNVYGAGFKFTTENYKSARIKNWNELKTLKYGTCEDMVYLTTYVARANGVPVTFDYVPAWGNVTGSGHCWNVIISTKKEIPFMGLESDFKSAYNPFMLIANRQPDKNTYKLPGKVFRHTFSSLNSDTPVDVTEKYFEVGNIMLPAKSDPCLNYGICVYNSGQWIQTFSGKQVNNSIIFERMAVNMLYLPIVLSKDKTYLEDLNYPLVLNSEKAITILAPDSLRRTNLVINTVQALTSRQVADFGKFSSLPASRFSSHMDSLATYTSMRRPESNVTYTLYYWDKDWIEVGNRTATNHNLMFKNVPSGALYKIVRMDGKTQSDRPFTYENGQQHWW